jgi:tRNA dimethylallyltransferase
MCAVTERIDVTHYVAKARAAVDAIAGRGRAVLVTGGSGFYLKSFFAPVADDIVVSAELRAEVAAMPQAELLVRLTKLNPGGLGALDVANPRRVTRALERCIASGKTLAVVTDEFVRKPGAFADWQVQLTRLDREPQDLDRRIEARVAAMLHAGLIEEVRRLRGEGLEENPSAALAIGYREVRAMLDGELPEAGLAMAIAKNTRALVKKQRTWFRTQLPVHRVLAAHAVRRPAELFAVS